MIVFDLVCGTARHRFEGWFASSGDFTSQQERGLVTCPQCGSPDVIKAPMAPAVPRKGNHTGPAQTAPVPQAINGAGLPPEAIRIMRALADMQAEALKSSRWVGSKFAEESRAIHYGEQDAETIHGEATLEEAKALIEEGIEVAPVLYPLAPPGKTN